MKNREKYKEEILKIDDCDGLIKEIMLPYYGKSCNDQTCSVCYLLQAMWLEEEYKEPEVDWSKVEVDTPIFTSCDGVDWYKRYFAKFEDGIIYAFCDGMDSWSSSSQLYPWNYAKLADKAKD